MHGTRDARVTFGKWLGIACALCISAQVNAATDLASPEASSFAYASRHAYWPVSDRVIERAADPDKFARVLNAIFYRDESSRKPLDPRAGVPHWLSTQTFCDLISATAQQNELPVSFFANLIWQESRFKVYSISPAGALGVAQFMPRTAVGYGLINPFEPIHAINASARFLHELRAQFGNFALAAMAYNAGPRRVIEWRAGRGPLPSETRNYVLRITGRSAEHWTDVDAGIDLEMSLLPLKAPCPDLQVAAHEQARRARVAGLIMELAKATAPVPTKPDRTDAKVADGSPQHRIRWFAHKGSRIRHSARTHPLRGDVASSR
jgi:hypothetical protein